MVIFLVFGTFFSFLNQVSFCWFFAIFFSLPVTLWRPEKNIGYPIPLHSLDKYLELCSFHETPEILLSFPPTALGLKACIACQIMTWVLGIWTQFLMLSQQGLLLPTKLSFTQISLIFKAFIRTDKFTLTLIIIILFLFFFYLFQHLKSCSLLWMLLILYLCTLSYFISMIHNLYLFSVYHKYFWMIVWAGLVIKAN